MAAGAVIRQPCSRLKSALRSAVPRITTRETLDCSDIRRVRELEEITARVEAEELLSEAQTLGDGTKLCARIFEDRDAESLKKLAHALMTKPQTIALLASRDRDCQRRAREPHHR